MQPGDAIQFTYQGKELKGILVQEKDGQATVKLSTGYNMIIPLDEMQEVKAEPLHREPHNAPAAKQNPMLPKVTILHTGGTIASKVDYKTGGVMAQFTPEELISMYPELHEWANIEAKLVSNIFSEDMNFRHFNKIAREVQAAAQAGATGVIVTHGTDIMHYTAAALSFMLEDLGIPVLLVGSQRSSDRGSSDASANLLAATQVITKTDFAGVAICMHASSDGNLCHLLPGTKARKLHSSRRDAFRPVNSEAIAHIDLTNMEITFLQEYERKKHTNIKVRPLDENLKVGMLYVHPNMRAEEIGFYKGYDGLLIAGLGIAGNLPLNATDDDTAENGTIAQALGELIAGGALVAASTQTIYGRVNMNVYATGRRMQEMGIIGHGHDMHPETAFIKLAWLLSNELEKAKELFTQNLRGEISSRSPLEDSHTEF